MDNNYLLWGLIAVFVGLVLLINVVAYNLFDASWALYDFSGIGSFVAGTLSLLFGGFYVMND